MNTRNSSGNANRIVWADLLRLMAILMVICIHCSDPFNVSPEARSNPEYNLWGSLYGTFMRPCVPLFVMLTGMLLLPVREEMNRFYKKRMLRIIVPFVVWSLLYNLFPYFTGIMGWNPSLLSTMFAYAGDAPSQSLESCLYNISMIPFKFNSYTIPLWYIYMLIGLYLYMPFLSGWLKQASDKQIRTFLYIWGATLFLPYLSELLGKDILGVSAWNSFSMLYYFAGFNGYLVLGYYLYNRKVPLPTLPTIVGAIVAFVVGYIITYIGFKSMTARPDITEEQLELFFLYCSPNVFLMTGAMFVLVQKIRITSSWAIRVLANITRCGLGIYMIHYFMVGIGYLVVNALNVPVSFRIPVTALLVFVLSWGIVALAFRIAPRWAKWVMG